MRISLFHNSYMSGLEGFFLFSFVFASLLLIHLHLHVRCISTKTLSPIYILSITEKDFSSISFIRSMFNVHSVIKSSLSSTPWFSIWIWQYMNFDEEGMLRVERTKNSTFSVALTKFSNTFFHWTNAYFHWRNYRNYYNHSHINNIGTFICPENLWICFSTYTIHVSWPNALSIYNKTKCMLSTTTIHRANVCMPSQLRPDYVLWENTIIQYFLDLLSYNFMNDCI